MRNPQVTIEARDAGEPGRSERRGALRRPVLLAVLAVVLIGYPNGDLSTAVRVANVTPGDIGAVLLVGVIGLQLLGGGDYGVLRSRLFLVPAFIVAVAAITTMFSTDPALSLVGVLRYAELFFLVPLAVVLALRDTVDLIWLLGSIVVLAVVEGVIGVYQTVTKTGAGFGEEAVRAIGTFGVGSQLAMSTVICVALIVLIAVALRMTGRSRQAAVVLSAFLAVPLLLSLSRGAVLALVVAAGAMVLATGLMRAVKMMVIATALAVVAVPLAGGQGSTVVERFATIATSATNPDRSVQDRYDLWATAVSMWKTSPVTGVGIKQFPAFRDSHTPLGTSSGSDQAGPDSYTRVQLLSPHNEYLLLLSEQGLLGLGGYLLLMAALAARHIRRLRSPSIDPVDDVLRVLSLGMLVFFACSDLYGDLAGPTAVLYSILLGVQLRSAVVDSSPLSPAPRPG